MKPLICLVFILLGVAVTSAQQKVIDKSEFDAAVKTGDTHRQKWAGKSYRMTVATSAQIIEKPEFDYSAKMIFEYGLNGDSRNSSNSSIGGKTTTTESLSVGGWIYSRKGTQPWTRRERGSGSGSGQSSDSGSGAGYEIVSSVTEYKHLGAGNIKGEPVQIYLRTERAKKVNRSSGDQTDSVIIRKYWIDADGLMLKNELITDGHSKNQNIHNTILIEWELDATIAFTEPEISPEP